MHMQDRMHNFMKSQQQEDNKRKDPDSSSTAKIRSEDYIEFEEVK